MIQTALGRAVTCLAFGLVLLTSQVRADDPAVPAALPLTVSPSLNGYEGAIEKPLTIAQQRARYEADQRMLRMQWNKWIGYEPLRPSLPNALTNNEMNPYYLQPVRYRPVWGVVNYGSRIW